MSSVHGPGRSGDRTLRIWGVALFDLDRARAAVPALLFGLRLWASVCLALYVAFRLELDNAYWAGTSAALVCQPHLGASLRKGWFRMIGTVVGAVAIVLLTACFAQNRVAFLAGLALWGAACALVATLLRNYASYAAALSGFTAAIIASDELGATGGANGLAFTLAVTRASEICIGIVCAGVVLAGTDLGSARRRLAALLASVSASIAGEFVAAFAPGGRSLAETQPVRRELIRQVIALDPVIDETLGESPGLRYHSPLLQKAVDGLFATLAGWRTMSLTLAHLPESEAGQQADAILHLLPLALRQAPALDHEPGWMANPIHLRRSCAAAVRTLSILPAATPSLRLLADQAAEVLTGLAQALNGLALLVGDPARPVQPRRGFRLRVEDWLPALINAARAFLAIGAAELLWIATEWPNGAGAFTWTAIAVIVLAPRAELAYANAVDFMVGTSIAAVFAAVMDFAVLPGLATFPSFCAAMGAFLIPAGALMALPWRPALFAPMAGNFLPLASPANQMSYDPAQFYNSTAALVAGISIAMLFFRLVPPLAPALRASRLLRRTLRDLRRLVIARVMPASDDWASRVYGRLSALPEAAEPLQRAQLVAALTVGTAVIHLRRVCPRFGADAELGAALAALAQGRGATAIACLAKLDERLALRSDGAAEPAEILRARARILAISEALAQHAVYFDADAPA